MNLFYDRLFLYLSISPDIMTRIDIVVPGKLDSYDLRSLQVCNRSFESTVDLFTLLCKTERAYGSDKKCFQGLV